MTLTLIILSYISMMCLSQDLEMHHRHYEHDPRVPLRYYFCSFLQHYIVTIHEVLLWMEPPHEFRQKALSDK
ncbi:unnamed protein product [Gongylonema pulchrum]|uniref:Secreted protein n=1 Tax=Gongylonema pulchrum TaxID=637853 RepID=A0A183DM43_9BILA|nr:unnamed protein product [Gongylonema pulchrum]